MSRKNNVNNLASVIQTGITNKFKDLHTVTVGEIISFDPETQTASVQPSIQRGFRNSDDEIEYVNLPLIENCPVVFLNSGGFAIELPVTKGDECLIFFAERSIGNWLNTGKSGPPNSARMHDLSDAICMVGISSKPNAIDGFDNTKLRLRSKNSSVTEIAVNEYTVEVTAQTNVSVDAPSVEVTATGTVNITAPTVTITGNTTVAGTLTVAGGLVLGGAITPAPGAPPVTVDTDMVVNGNLTQNGNITHTGNYTFTGVMTVNGVNFSTHTHTYLDNGVPAQTTPPV